MIARGQQRGQPQRGSVPFKALATALDIPWLVVGGGPGTVNIQPDPVAGQVSLNGVPQFVRGDTLVTPTGVTWDGTTLVLTFSSPVPPSTRLSLAAKDPAFRTTTGAYLSAGSQFSPELPGPAVVNIVPGAGTCAVRAVSIAQAGSTTITATAGTWTSDWFTVVNPDSNLTDVTVNGVSINSPVAAGVVQGWTWDGAAWV